MLTYFPTPYPGEWMYSVLCRYHLRSGRDKSQTSIWELFGGKPTADVGSIFPNSTISEVMRQLPSGCLNTKTIILNHTLFLYYTRCYQLEQKEKLLAQLCSGTTSIRCSGHSSVPRYCPLCAMSDRRTYGEAYWHIEHQIPAMEVCVQHGCKLLTVEGASASQIRFTFYPLDVQSLAVSSAPPAHPWQMKFARILHDYATLPLSCASTPGYSNLAISLGGMGYEVIQQNNPYTILDAERVYHDLAEHYGEKTVEQVIGDEKAIHTINQVCKWECLIPERYALLQCFAGIDSSIVFSPKRLPGLWENQLRNMAKSGGRYGRKQLCEALGITASQLNILARKYDLSPFWTHQEKQLHKISVVFNDTEHEQFKQALARSGFRYDRHFAHHCIMEYLKHHKED